MKRIPDFPPKMFYRIRPPQSPALEEMITNGTTGVVDAELAGKGCTKGHGLVLASWDGSEFSKVEALGIVIGVSASGKREVEWTRGPFELRMPDMGGAHFWKQATFKFAKTVAEGFGLTEFFRKRCKDPFAASRN